MEPDVAFVDVEVSTFTVRQVGGANAGFVEVVNGVVVPEDIGEDAVVAKVVDDAEVIQPEDGRVLLRAVSENDVVKMQPCHAAPW